MGNNEAEMVDDSRPLTKFLFSSDDNVVLQLLMAYITNPRQESPVDDESQAHNDATLLYKAGEGRLGTDEAAIIEIFSTRTARQLNASFRRYKESYSQDIEKVWIIHYSSSYFLLGFLRCCCP